jgi:predicted nucleic acid-binding Zn ribbon protein
MRRSNWVSAGDAVRRWASGARVKTERLMILNQIWEKEVGHLARHWTLSGVRSGVLYVKTMSPAAAQELQLRSQDLLRGLNRHFDQAWIKEIRASS